MPNKNGRGYGRLQQADQGAYSQPKTKNIQAPHLRFEDGSAATGADLARWLTNNPEMKKEVKHPQALRIKAAKRMRK